MKDDKPGYTENSGVIPSDVSFWSVRNFSMESCLQIEQPIDNTQACLLPHNITNENRMNLGNGGYRKQKRYLWSIRRTVEDLYLEGRIHLLTV